MNTDPATLMSVMRGTASLDEVLAAGQLELTGDRATVEQFARLFPIPDQ